MRRYVFIRTDKRRSSFILKELEAGRLRQGWGWRPEHDLRALKQRIASGEKLNDELAAVWRNRRLLHTEPDGLKPGDIVVTPNVPEQGRWVIARVTGPYRFERAAPADNVGEDYGHIVDVSPVRRPDGSVGVIEADNEIVDARLRASTRSMSRMWSVDALGAAVDQLVAAVERGADTLAVLPETKKVEGLFAEMQAATWAGIVKRYKAEELEHLVHHLLQQIYAGGRVEHWGGAGEKGADLIVFTRDPLDLEFKIAVQVKMHRGTDDDLHSLEQIKLARQHHKVDAGIVITTADEVSARFEERRAALEAELQIDIRVIMKRELLQLVLRNLTATKP